MNKTSLRALGAATLAKQFGADPELIAPHVTDSIKNVEHSLKEAENAGAVFFDVSQPPEEAPEYGHKDLTTRIYNLFCVHKAYETIGWFLTESGLGADTSDEYLKGLVRHEYDSALAVRLWDRDVVKSAFYEVKSKKRGEHITMSDILEALQKRSKGYE